MQRGRGLAVGGLLLAAGLCLAKSDHPVVLHRWSYAYTAIIGFVVVCSTTIGAFAFTRRAKSPYSDWRIDPVGWIDAGAFCFGLAYIVHAVVFPESASAAVDLNLTGSVVPVSVILEWVAMVCVTLALGFAARRLPVRYATPALTFGALLVAVLALEGLARAAAILDPEVQGYPTARTRMWRRRFMDINPSGFRDSTHALVAAPGRPRLLMVGDSYAAGDGLDDPHDRLGEQLAESVSARVGERWEVIHAVRGDTHTLKHLEFLEEGLRYHPDVVMLLYVFNDMDYLRPAATHPQVTMHPNGILDRLRPERLLYVNSFLVQELTVRVRHLLFSPADAAAHSPYSDSAKVATHLSDLQRFVDRARSAGATPVIVPFDIGVIASPVLRERYQKFLSQLRAAELPTWSLENAFDGETLDNLSVNPLDRHPNTRANKLATAAVLPHFMQLTESRRAMAPAAQITNRAVGSD